MVVQETRSVECAACCLGANGLLRAAPVLKTPSRAPKIALHERTATDTRRASENSDSGRPATITMDKNEPTPEAPQSSEVAISQRKAVFQNTALSRRPGKRFLLYEMWGCWTKSSIESHWCHILFLDVTYLVSSRHERQHGETK